MEKVFDPFFPLLISLPVLMAALSLVKFLRQGRAEFRHLTEFFISMALDATCSWFLWPKGPAFVILSMFPWVWTLRTFGSLIQDISGISLFSKYHYYVLGLASVGSIVFLSFDFPLPMVVTPFSLGVGLIGLTFIFQAYLKGQGNSYGLLHHLNFFLMLTFFVSRLCFPVMIEEEWSTQWAVVGQHYLMIVLGTCIFPLYAEIVFERHERVLEEVVLARNRQLFGHSSFSEYKILSAGLSHEVNNALTIINAKIALILRGRGHDLEADLRMVQDATNRIVKSIRGLREFIYPHDVPEVLDLGDLVQNVLSIYGQRLNNHAVEASTSALAGKLVMGHKIQLEQVFLSLINNSVEAVDELDEKWIKVTARSVGKTIQITYQDSSASKAQQITPLLEDPFTSAKEFKDDDVRLVLVKEILGKHGGTIHCGGNNDFSTFLLALPQADAIKSTDSDLRGKIEEIGQSLH